MVRERGAAVDSSVEQPSRRSIENSVASRDSGVRVGSKPSEAGGSAEASAAAASPPSYAQRLADRIESTAEGAELLLALGEDVVGMRDHIEAVLVANGMVDLPGRAQLVAAAAAKQQVKAERKPRKKERQGATDESKAPLPSPGRGPAGTSVAGEAAAPAEPDTSDTWTVMQVFMTEEEALRFIIECQPIDYRPAERCGDEPCPSSSSSSSREMFEYCKLMQPWPREFVAAEERFHRRLRIRKQDPPDEQPTISVSKNPVRLCSSVTAVRRVKNSAAKKQGGLADTVTNLVEARKFKPWIVEAGGSLFGRLESLRDLHRETLPSRYFIAIDAELEKKVLTEGYRVRRRCSIPCSASVAEARQAFTKLVAEKNQQLGPLDHRPSSTRAVVLAVTLPLGIDVIANRSGGYLLRTQEISPQCLKSIRRPGGNELS